MLVTFDLQAVDSVFVNGLKWMQRAGVNSEMRRWQSRSHDWNVSLTCPGPIMVPFQFVINTSSPSSSPYEHDPSPSPFSPFSSSSNNLKFLGTDGESEESFGFI